MTMYRQKVESAEMAGGVGTRVASRPRLFGRSATASNRQLAAASQGQAAGNNSRESSTSLLVDAAEVAGLTAMPELSCDVVPATTTAVPANSSKPAIDNNYNNNNNTRRYSTTNLPSSLPEDRQVDPRSMAKLIDSRCGDQNNNHYTNDLIRSAKRSSLSAIPSSGSSVVSESPSEYGSNRMPASSPSFQRSVSCRVQPTTSSSYLHGTGMGNLKNEAQYEDAGTCSTAAETEAYTSNNSNTNGMNQAPASPIKRVNPRSLAQQINAKMQSDPTSYQNDLLKQCSATYTAKELEAKYRAGMGVGSTATTVGYGSQVRPAMRSVPPPRNNSGSGGNNYYSSYSQQQQQQPSRGGGSSSSSVGGYEEVTARDRAPTHYRGTTPSRFGGTAAAGWQDPRSVPPAPRLQEELDEEELLQLVLKQSMEEEQQKQQQQQPPPYNHQAYNNDHLAHNNNETTLVNGHDSFGSSTISSCTWMSGQHPHSEVPPSPMSHHHQQHQPRYGSQPPSQQQHNYHHLQQQPYRGGLGEHNNNDGYAPSSLYSNNNHHAPAPPNHRYGMNGGGHYSNNNHNHHNRDPFRGSRGSGLSLSGYGAPPPSRNYAPAGYGFAQGGRHNEAAAAASADDFDDEASAIQEQEKEMLELAIEQSMQEAARLEEERRLQEERAMIEAAMAEANVGVGMGNNNSGGGYRNSGNSTNRYHETRELPVREITTSQDQLRLEQLEEDLVRLALERSIAESQQQQDQQQPPQPPVRPLRRDGTGGYSASRRYQC